ncbi:MAG: hypothetical protein ACT4N4_13720 [Rhodospirillales bacterium]
MLLLSRTLFRLGLALIAGGAMWLAAQGLPRQSEDEAVLAEVRRAAGRERVNDAVSAALDRGDVEDATAYAELADHAALPLSENLRRRLAEALAFELSWAGRLRRCAGGVFMGDMTSALAAICTLAADFTPLGDMRDIAIQGARGLEGRDYDAVVLGLSVAGLGATALTYASAGTGAPAKAGVSVLKGVRRTGALNPRLWLALERAGAGGGAGLMRAAGEVNAVRRAFGAAEAAKMLRFADQAEDVGEIARFYGKFGRKARPIMELTGKTALRSFKAGYKLTAALGAQLALILGSGCAILLALALRGAIMKRAGDAV